MRVLLITQSSPFPPVTGARQRTSLLFRALASIGDVDVFLQDIGSPGLQQSKSILEAEYNVVEWIRPSKRQHKIAPQHGLDNLTPDRDCLDALQRCLTRRRYDLIIGRYVPSFLRTGAFGYSPIILDIDDVPDMLIDDVGETSGASVNEFGLLRSELRRLLARCNAIWSVNESDRQYQGLENAILLPNIPYYRYSECQPPPSTGCILFVGALKHSPNKDGINQFLDIAWPRIRSRCPQARLQIAGYGLEPQCQSNWSLIPGVDFLGFVDDLAPLYHDCVFTIVPTTAGHGTHVKLIESASFGRTSVVTTSAHRGYEKALLEDIAVLVAHNMDEFADKTISLLNNHTANCALSFQAQKAATEQYTFERFQEIVTHTVNKVLQSKAAGLTAH
jgi:hypothetical protein